MTKSCECWKYPTSLWETITVRSGLLSGSRVEAQTLVPVWTFENMFNLIEFDTFLCKTENLAELIQAGVWFYSLGFDRILVIRQWYFWLILCSFIGILNLNNLFCWCFVKKILLNCYRCATQETRWWSANWRLITIGWWHLNLTLMEMLQRRLPRIWWDLSLSLPICPFWQTDAFKLLC